MIRFLLNFFSPPRFNDTNHRDMLWGKDVEARATQMLGDGIDAHTTLDEIADLIHADRCRPRSSFGWWHRCDNEHLHEEILDFKRSISNTRSAVGDPKHVHFIMPPAHSIGYAIWRGKDDLSKEVIEGLDYSMNIIRKRGRIVNVTVSQMIRHESYGNHRII